MPRIYRRRPPEERFWPKVDRSGGPDACWPWKAGRHRFGYGYFALTHQKSVGAHRFVWEVTFGPVPVGLHVLHKCDNPPCCNPAHLFLGTNLDNIADMVRKGRHARGDRQGLRKHPEAPARGERHHNARFTAEQVREIRALYATGKHTQREIARRYGVTQPAIGHIVRRKLWTHI